MSYKTEETETVYLDQKGILVKLKPDIKLISSSAETILIAKAENDKIHCIEMKQASFKRCCILLAILDNQGIWRLRFRVVVTPKHGVMVFPMFSKLPIGTNNDSFAIPDHLKNNTIAVIGFKSKPEVKSFYVHFDVNSDDGVYSGDIGVDLSGQEDRTMIDKTIDSTPGKETKRFKRVLYKPEPTPICSFKSQSPAIAEWVFTIQCTVIIHNFLLKKLECDLNLIRNNSKMKFLCFCCSSVDNYKEDDSEDDDEWAMKPAIHQKHQTDENMDDECSAAPAKTPKTNENLSGKNEQTWVYDCVYYSLQRFIHFIGYRFAAEKENEGDEQFKAENYTAAINFYKEAMNFHPNDKIYAKLIESYILLGNVDEAQQAIDELAKIGCSSYILNKFDKDCEQLHSFEKLPNASKETTLKQPVSEVK